MASSKPIMHRPPSTRAPRSLSRTNAYLDGLLGQSSLNYEPTAGRFKPVILPQSIPIAPTAIAIKPAESPGYWWNISGTTPGGSGSLTGDSPKPGKGAFCVMLCVHDSPEGYFLPFAQVGTCRCHASVKLSPSPIDRSERGSVCLASW